MLRFVTRLLAVGAIAIPLLGQAADTPASPEAPTAAQMTKMLQDYRTDLQTKRADVISKNVTLSAAEAAKFWPLYEKYQAEQNAIMDAQLKGTQSYVNDYATLDDAKALSYLDVLLSRDESMAALRRKYLPQFQKVVPAHTAVRVMQIDRRLSLLAQLELSARLPLIR